MTNDRVMMTLWTRKYDAIIMINDPLAFRLGFSASRSLKNPPHEVDFENPD